MPFLNCFADPSKSVARDSTADPLLSTSTTRPIGSGGSRPSGDERYKPGCIFCEVSVDKGFNVVWENEELIAFHDRSPRASLHLLIIPRHHVVSNVRELDRDHVSLLKRMSARGAELASELSLPPSLSSSRSTAQAHIPQPPDHPAKLPNKTKMGFHIPPFSSVAHLHMHVLVPPYTAIGRVKYPLTTSRSTRGKTRHHGDGSEAEGGGASGGRKGWSWFVSVDQAIWSLERGRRIGLGKG